MKPSCQVDIKLLIQTPIFHLKRELNDNNNRIEISTESPLSPKPVEPNTKPTGKTQQNALQIHHSSYSELFIEKLQLIFVRLQQKWTEVFSKKQTWAENVRLKLQHQRRIEAANQMFQKQELEWIQLLQQMNKPDTVNQDDNNTLEITQMVPLTSKMYNLSK